MNKLFEKPHLLFFISVPIILLIGFFYRDSAIDFNIHDTYFVISDLHLSSLISIIYGIIGIGYWVHLKTNRKLIKSFVVLHIILTIGGTITFFGISFIPVNTFMDSDSSYFDAISRQDFILSMLVLLIFLAQGLYLVNLIIDIYKENKNKG